jgi:hypothetical protein
VVSAVIVDFRFGFEVGVSGVAGLSSSTCTMATSAFFSGTVRRVRGARTAVVALGGTAGAWVVARAVVMGLGSLIVTLVLVAGATVAVSVVVLAAVLVVVELIGGARD